MLSLYIGCPNIGFLHDLEPYCVRTFIALMYCGIMYDLKSGVGP